MINLAWITQWYVSTAGSLSSAITNSDLTPKQIYKRHENENKRQYAERVMEIERGTFTPLVFTTKGGMADECVKCHSRVAKLIANQKGESYSSAIFWIRAKVSFAIVSSAILY